MSRYPTDEIAEYYAQTYDESVSDWPGEIDFYRAYAAEAHSKSLPILELACGTGRVALRIAQDGPEVVGLDLSSAMLDVARSKSTMVPNIEWVEGDMRSFDLGQVFGLVIIPGHSFQNLLTPSDQLSCLLSTRRHLVQDGVLVMHLDHLDITWLGNLMGDEGGAFKPAEQFIHPRTGMKVQASRAWWYERSTQTAIVETVWEEHDDHGKKTNRISTGKIRIHCAFRFEIEHLLKSAGFTVINTFGDFSRGELTDQTDEMIWVAKLEN